MSLVTPTPALAELGALLGQARNVYNDPRTRAAARTLVRFGRRVAQSSLAKKAQRYKNKARSQTGEDIGGDTAKATRIRSDGAQLYATNIAYFNDPIQIDRRSTASYLLNQRERDIVYLSGIKICLTVHNNLAVIS